jgi:hypothetical protein
MVLGEENNFHSPHIMMGLIILPLVSFSFECQMDSLDFFSLWQHWGFVLARQAFDHLNHASSTFLL